MTVNLDDVCKDTVKRVKAVYSDKLVSIILYGSYARGDYDRESDIDIAILVDLSREELHKYRKNVIHISSELDRKYDCVSSLRSIPASDFSRRIGVLPYYQNIKKEGVPLYGNI